MVPLLYRSRFQAARSIKSCLELGEKGAQSTLASWSQASPAGNSWRTGELSPLVATMGFPGGSDGKASAYSAGDPGLMPGSGRSPGEGNGNPLQYSCLENPMDWGSR